MSIIMRAFCLRGVSSANFAQSPPLSSVWQSVQLKLVEAAKNPIVCMKLSTGIPLRIWTFLKACSARIGLSPAGAWPGVGRAGAPPIAKTADNMQKDTAPAAPSVIRLDPSPI